MSYHIDCRGVGRFRRSDSGITIGDVFDLADALGHVSAGAVGGAAGVARNMAEDRVRNGGSGTSNLQRGMGTIAQREGISILGQGATMMVAMHGRTTVNLSCFGHNLIMPDPADSAFSDLTTNDSSPGYTVMRDLWPALEHTGLNGGLVLMAMGGMMFDFASHDIRDARRSILNFVIRAG